MSDKRRFGWRSGRLPTTPIADFLQISTTVQDPAIPNLPLETPAGGAVALTATNLDAGTPALGTPVLGQIHALATAGIATSAPTVGAPVIGQVHVLSAAGLSAEAPTLGAPDIGQVHALAAADLATSQPTLGTPTLAIAGGEVPAAPRFQMDYDAYVRRRREKDKPQEQPEAETYDEEIAVLLLAA